MMVLGKWGTAAASLCLLLCLCGQAVAAVKPVTVTPAAPDIRYIGRWDRAEKDEAIGQWTGACLKVAFTGTTVAVRVGDTEPSSFYARIDDGAATEYADRNGAVNIITPADGLTPGMHQLFLVAKVGKTLRFRGIELAPGARTTPPKVARNTVLFIGDSITSGASATNPTLDAWAPKAAMETGAESVRIAQGGIGLVDGYHAPIGSRGMEKQFFKLGAFSTPRGFTPYMGFAADRPALIIVNLGTNDGNKNEKNPVTMGVFRERYAAFLKALRTIYPNTPILALELFNRNKDKCEAIRQAVAQTVRETEDERFRVISTDGWVNPNPVGGDIAPDWSHPTDQGHAKLAQRMADVLRENLSPKETNR